MTKSTATTAIVTLASCAVQGQHYEGGATYAVPEQISETHAATLVALRRAQYVTPTTEDSAPPARKSKAKA